MLRLLLIVISFVYVSSDRWGLIHFTQNSTELSKCIKHHDSIKFLGSDDKSKNLEIDAFINFLAQAFAETTRTREEIPQGITSSIDSGLGYITSWYMRDPKFRVDLEEEIARALEDCFGDRVGNSNSVESLSYVRLPQFLQELNGIGSFLDFVLVNRHARLQDMIIYPNIRALLRRYAEDALDSLLHAYNSNSQMFFNYLVRNVWIARARLFFDGRNTNLPYIDHIFNIENPTPHTYGDTQRFISRRSVDYDVRNPVATPFQQNRILNMYPEVNSPSDIYTRYRRNGMRSDDYYFEDHLNQFYRIIFFFLEMQLHGIPQNADDIPEHIREILYDDDAYREYLIRRRNELIHGEDHPARDRLRRSDRVREVDLIILLGMRISNGVIETMTTTTSEKYSVSTTPKFEDEKSNRSFGRIFSKWMKKFSQKFEGQFNDEYFGYINDPTSKGDQTMFLTDILNSYFNEFCLHKYI